MIAIRYLKLMILIAAVTAFLSAGAFAQPTQSASSATPAPLKTVTLQKPIRVQVPQGDPVFVFLDEPLDSGNAEADETFSFTAAKPILVSDCVVVPQGAHGEGHVDSVSKAKWMGRPGTIVVSFDWITSADGKRLRLVNSVSQVGDDNLGTSVGVDIGTTMVTAAAIQTGATAASGLLSAAVPFAGLATLAIKGKNVHVGTNVPLRAFIARSAHVLAHEKAVGIPASSEYDQ